MSDKTKPQIWQWDYLGMKPLLREMKKFVVTLPAEYKLLDLGCGNKPYKSLFSGATQYTGLDIVAGPEVDVVGNAWELPFPDNSFDVIISTQVLEHTEKVEQTVSEIQRVVKPGGKIFISAPFAFQEHGMPYDYWRFTQSGLRSVFKNFTIEEIKPLQGTIGTLSRLWNAFIVNMGPQPLTHYIFIPIYLMSNVIGAFSDWLIPIIFRLEDVLVLLILKRKRTSSFLKNYFALTENYVLRAVYDPVSQSDKISDQ